MVLESVVKIAISNLTFNFHIFDFEINVYKLIYIKLIKHVYGALKVKNTALKSEKYVFFLFFFVL